VTERSIDYGQSGNPEEATPHEDLADIISRWKHRWLKRVTSALLVSALDTNTVLNRGASR
jgi:hypothetical protein